MTTGRGSILWEDGRRVLDRSERDVGMKVVSDLQLDRVLRTVCPDIVLREAFLSVLVSPCTESADINGRTAVLRTFRRIPQLVDTLIETVRHLCTVKNMWDSDRARIHARRAVNPNDRSELLWSARESLVQTAHFIGTANLDIHRLYETLNMFGCTDGWLGELRETAFALSESESSRELRAYADKLERGLLNAHTYEVEFAIGDDMYTEPYFLRDFSATVVTERVRKKQRLPILSLFERNERSEEVGRADTTVAAPPPSVRVSGADLDHCFDTALRAVRETDRYLTSFLRAAIDRLCGLETELYFYKAAMLYCDRYEERGIGLVYPELREAGENVIDIKSLYDVLLLTESMSVLSVVPNDVYFCGGRAGGETAGILITGQNNSGKTVYLRSVGTAVLLAQCGLPIPCTSAIISLRRRIFTVFATSEGELQPLSSAGRFEEEVTEIARVVDALEPSSLLLMNEIFQTTSYEEGAEGMYHILRYMSSCGCGFLFVTHLMGLIEAFASDGGVEVLRTCETPRERYKVKRVQNP